MGDTDVADRTAWPSGLDGLPHRFLGADRFDDRVCPQAVGELFDAFHPGIAALGDDVGGSEFAGQSLAGFVATHRHDPLGAELTGSQYRAQPDRAVTDHYHGLTWPRFGGNGAEPARTQHVGGRQEVRDEIVGGTSGVATRVPSASGTRIRWACAPPAVPRISRLTHDV